MLTCVQIQLKGPREIYEQAKQHEAWNLNKLCQYRIRDKEPWATPRARCSKVRSYCCRLSCLDGLDMGCGKFLRKRNSQIKNNAFSCSEIRL